MPERGGEHRPEPAEQAPPPAEPPPGQDSGAAAVRSALARARAAAAAKGLTPGTPANPTTRRRRRRPQAGDRSGSGPDARDPQPLGAVLGRMVADQGWQQRMSVGGVMGRWETLVGPDIAAHCTPESFDDGRLVLRTSSTAWATQLRMLRAGLLAKLTNELGPGVVTELVIRAPSAPSWRHGPRSSGGRGPRDTYG